MSSQPQTTTKKPAQALSSKQTARLEVALRAALNRHTDSAARWQRLVADGASNDDLLHALRDEFGTGGAADDDAGRYAYSGTTAPKFWLGHTDYQTKKPPTLAGTELVSQVRRLLRIPYPDEARKPATEPTVKLHAPKREHQFWRNAAAKLLPAIKEKLRPYDATGKKTLHKIELYESRIRDGLDHQQWFETLIHFAAAVAEHNLPAILWGLSNETQVRRLLIKPPGESWPFSHMGPTIKSCADFNAAHDTLKQFIPPLLDDPNLDPRFDTEWARPLVVAETGPAGVTSLASVLHEPPIPAITLAPVPERATFEHEVEVELNDHAIALKAKEAADLGWQIEELEGEKQETLATYKKKIGGLEEVRDELMRAIRRGRDTLMLSCYERPDYKRKVVETRRADDNAVVDTRPMKPSEYQTSFID